MVAEGASPNFLGTVLSTIPPPLPLDVVIIYRDSDLTRTARERWPAYIMPPSVYREAKIVLHHRQRFEAFYKMHTARDFRLVLCIDDPDHDPEHCAQLLGGIVEAEKAAGRLDYLLCGPLIASEMWPPRPRLCDGYTSRAGMWDHPTSAL